MSCDDEDEYTCGCIGAHLVVLVWISRRKIRALFAAKGLSQSFRKIKNVLLVGICGGMPKAGKDEVLLGDVIIGTRLAYLDQARHTSRHYITGPRFEPGGEFGRFLNKLKNSNTSRWRLKQLVADYLEDFFRDPDFADSRYLLCESTHLHKHDDTSQCIMCRSGVCDAAMSLSCSHLNCGESHSLQRERLKDSAGAPPPTPRIHFGAVGSGDTVMKSGIHRDDIANKERIIAFEMEGEGVCKSFDSVVVIKGVCDYADSHKNKVWQPYAAITAAACAKAFLKLKEDRGGLRSLFN